MAAMSGELRAAVLALFGAAIVGSASADDGPKKPPAAEPPPASTASATEVAPVAPSAAPAAARRRYAVAAMGDSLTDPKSHGGKYLELLRQRCPLSRFDSYGKGGNMVNQMRARFARDVFGDPLPVAASAGPPVVAVPVDPLAPPGVAEGGPRPAYTHALVLGGINDICSDETALRTNDQIETDLGAMYDLAHARGLSVVALTLPPWGGFKKFYNARRGRSTREINQWIRDQKALGKVDAVLDVYPLLSCGKPTELCESYGLKDHVHWSAKGHAVVGEALHRQVFSDCE
ncbi:MAG: hypothetical protein IT373_00560 [Polyangiaceae bacterium]|nr:hypothetical protein [Polyangiaceae bacterium]